VPVDVRLPGLGIDVEAKIHAFRLPQPLRPSKRSPWHARGWREQPAFDGARPHDWWAPIDAQAAATWCQRKGGCRSAKFRETRGAFAAPVGHATQGARRGTSRGARGPIEVSPHATCERPLSEVSRPSYNVSRLLNRPSGQPSPKPGTQVPGPVGRPGDAAAAPREPAAVCYVHVRRRRLSPLHSPYPGAVSCMPAPMLLCSRRVSHPRRRLKRAPASAVHHGLALRHFAETCPTATVRAWSAWSIGFSTPESRRSRPINRLPPRLRRSPTVPSTGRFRAVPRSCPLHHRSPHLRRPAPSPSTTRSPQTACSRPASLGLHTWGNLLTWGAQHPPC